jgi:tricorn protease
MRHAVLAACLLLAPFCAQAEIKLLRHPSYSKGKIAFSYLGDIWTVNEDGSSPERLTDHKARDVYPRFSPDGQWIAFSSNRSGNYDVYVISAKGGKARQLTFHNADDDVITWTPDGQRIVFRSTRGDAVFPTVASLYQIPVDGGIEQPLPTDWGSSASYSADGSKMAFTRHPGVWSRKHYRGSYAVDLWLMDVAAKKFTRLGDGDYKGNYMWPMYGRGGDIYFVADRLPNEKNVVFAGPEVMKSVNNIWKVPEKGGKPVQVTRHTSGSLFFPSISADGRVIVYEENFGLWKLDVASGKSAEIRVNLASDDKENAVELRTFQNEAESFSLSPSAKRAAISTHGEIFTIATDRGELQRVTETSWRETDPQWSPNGRLIAFYSDRSGREELWVADERGRNLKKVSDVDSEKGSLVWSPDSKWLAYTGSDHKLRRVEVETGKAEEVASSDVGGIMAPQFSPDGKWMSYAKDDKFLRPHVFVKALADGSEKMIGGSELFSSTGAKWTPDGKKLLLLAGVGSSSLASTQRMPMQLYSVSLTRLDKNPLERGIDSEEQAAAAAATERRGPVPGGPGAGGGPPRVEVKIDWDGLDRRIRPVTRTSDSILMVAPSPDSRTYAFIAAGEQEGRFSSALYTVGDDGQRITRVAQSMPQGDGEEGPRGRGGFGGAISSPQWSRDGRSIYYLDGRSIFSVAVPGGGGDSGGAPPSAAGLMGRRSSGPPAAPASPGGATPQRVNFSVKLEIDRAAERRQVFEECWRVMNYRFYDAKMHGVNWAAAKDNYASLLGNIGDSDELRAVIMQMIGELNASHTGVTGPSGISESVQTRYPGFDLQADPSGLFRVGHIYKKGPADHDYVKLSRGDYLLAVNGRDLKTTDNYWKIFNILPGRKFEFLVNSRPQKEGAWTVSLEPLPSASFNNLQYERWVDSRKAMVDRISNNEIGYLHIRAMDQPSLRKFERDLMENQGKKALIIDQRFNGGGGIDQELLAILNQRKYQVTRRRDSVDQQRPNRAYFGPMVVMQNERSASDAEMFPDGFRSLGLGKIVGVPTYGAVIGTGAYRLLDGGSIRTPSFGVWNAKGANMENYGVPPDVYVDNLPSDFLAGRDAQIEKAIEVLKEQTR